MDAQAPRIRFQESHLPTAIHPKYGICKRGGYRVADVCFFADAAQKCSYRYPLQGKSSQRQREFSGLGHRQRRATDHS